MTSSVQVLRIPRGPDDPRGAPLGLRFPYNKRMIESLKDAAIPGLRFDYAKKLWTGYHDAIELGLTALRKAGFDAPPPDAPPGPPADVTLPVAYAELRDYQKIGVRFLVDNATTGVLLADDMGLGKTATSVRAARAFARPTVVVHPPNARHVWGGSKTTESAIERWWPAAGKPRALDGVLEMPFRLGYGKSSFLTRRDPPPKALLGLGLSGETLAQAFTFREAKAWAEHNLRTRALALRLEPIQLPPLPLVTTVHQDILYAWAPHLLGILRANGGGTLIIDEIHAFVHQRTFSAEKGPKGPRRSEAAMLLSRAAWQVMALTGTPMDGLPWMMFAALDIISPGRFGNYYAYTEKYANGRMEQVTDERRAWKADGVTNAPELRHRLSWLMLRRTKGEVAKELPSRTRLIHEVIVPKKNAALPRTASTRAMRRAMELAGQGKIPEAARRALAAAETAKVVVYTYRREVCEAIATGIHAAAPKMDVQFIHGGITFAPRARIIESKPQILVTTMDVVSGAIALTFSTHGIFAELHPKPNVILQCEARHHRIGQAFPVTYEYLIALGSLDEMLRDRILVKLAAFEEAIGAIEGNLASDLKTKSDDEILSDMFREIMGGTP